MNAALLILRVVVGLGFASHGTQKLFGWFGGYGISGTGAYFESIGFRPGPRFALAAGLSEVFGGLLLALGFLGPIGPALMLLVMVVAVLTVHRGHGFYAYNNGAEVPIVYSTVAVTVALAGPGQYSLDRMVGISSFVPEYGVGIILACGILSGLASLALRHPPEVVESKAA